MHLPAIQTQSGLFALLQLNNTLAWMEQCGIDVKLDLQHQLTDTLIKLLLENLAPASSGVSVDPEYGLPVFLAAQRHEPLVLPLHQPADTDWGIEHIANNYAVATFALNYHPYEDQALAKKQLVAEMYDYCLNQHVDLLLQLTVPAELDVATAAGVTWAELQLQAAQEFRAIAHGLVLQLPPDSLSSATITAELDIPWLVDMTGLTYAVAKDGLRQSLESGAQGLMVGDSLWQEIYSMRQADASPDLTAITAFVTTEAKDRMIELRRIVDEYTLT